MASGTEFEVLKALRKKGGETTISAIAAEIRMSSDYARIVCRGLGMADYVDVFNNGRVRLAEKGIEALRKVPREEDEAGPTEGESGTNGEKDQQKPLSPEEKYLLWSSR